MGEESGSAHDRRGARRRRLLRSLFWGVLLPVCYSFIAGPISSYVRSPLVRLLLYLPVGWCRYLYYLLFPRPALMRFGEFSFFIYIVISNVALYTCLIYVGLWLLSQRRRGERAELSPPPPPPAEFDEDSPPRSEQPGPTARR